MAKRQKISTVGETHNKWTVIEEIGMTSNGHLKVMARCECGTVKEVFYNKLKHGTSKCCGKCGIKEYKPGDRVGRWTILYKADCGKKRKWHCRCDCGVERDVIASKLDHGRTNSCGCYATELVIQRTKTHGMSRTRIHREWSHMRQRCLPNAECHKRYYDRGIRVCDEWQNSFENFYDYVSKLENFGKPSYSLDRIDNNRGYEEGNVRWADSKMQSLNKENTVFLTYRGETKTLCEWSEITGVPYGRIYSRIKYHGMSVEDAIEKPVVHKTKV